MKLDNVQRAFAKFDDVTAVIVEKGDYDDYENTYTLTEKDEISGDLQPYSGGMLEKEYGFNRECQKRLFIAPNDSITEGVYLRIGTKYYIVVYVANRKIRQALILREVDLDD